MKKLKLFLENIFIYGFGGVISKIISFIMVPIVARLMPDSSIYGINDLVTTIISFSCSIAVMGMYDAMYRMFFEKEDLEYKKEICSTVFYFVLFSSTIVFILLLLGKKLLAGIVLKDFSLGYLIIIAAISVLFGSTNTIIAAPTRMQNKRTVFLITNTFSSLMGYLIAIILILKKQYLIAMPLASLITSFFIEMFFLILNHKWFSIKKVNFSYLKPLMLIAIPLLPNFLIYWVFNSCDKLMLSGLIDLSATGIYSVGAKLGHASQLIQTAFSGGWLFFAYSTMKDENQAKTNSQVFEYMSIISFASAVFIFALSKPIYQILFTGEYVKGYIASPYLFLAPLLQMLFQISSNQFLVIKKTWYIPFILIIGAIANVLLNLLLIPKIGIEGAAIATLGGYFLSDVLCIGILCKMKLHFLTIRHMVSDVIMCIYILTWRIIFKDNILVSFVLAIAVVSVFTLLYFKDIKSIIGKIIKHSQKKG